MVVDSSVWLSILLSQHSKNACLKIMKGEKILIPTLCFYECFKKLREKVSDHEAVEAISFLQQYPQLDFTSEVALTAADLSLEYNLAMADSIILAHARVLHDVLLTLDNDFAEISGVKVLRA